VEEGARLELPLWMAERLAAGQFVGVELPRNFSGSVRDALLAAPKSARLRERSPYFYEAGLRLAGLSHLEEARSLPAAIQATLATRVHMILLRAQHSSERVQASDFLEPLTDLEQRLFWGGYRHQRDLLAWRGLHTWEIRAGALTAPCNSRLRLQRHGAQPAGGRLLGGCRPPAGCDASTACAGAT